MKTEVVEYRNEDEGLDVRLTVTAGTVLTGMRRARLKQEADKVDDSDLDIHLLRIITYPDLVSATIEAEGLDWPLSFDDFLALPDRLAGAWENAVYRLNPHWLEFGDADAKKKSQTTSTGDSASGKKRKRTKDHQN